MVQHIVFGAGLIGCFLGGAFAANKAKVTLVGRASTQEKLAGGLMLTDYQGNQQLVNNIACVTGAEQAPKADILWLTVKCTGIEQAIAEIAPLLTSSTLIICCQNGLGAKKQAKAAYPQHRVLTAIVPFNVVESSPGHLHRSSEGLLTIEHNEISHSEMAAISQSLSSALLPMRLYQGIEKLQWAKLQLNLSNAVNALADIPLKAMLEQRGYRKLISQMMEELLAVAKAKSLTLPKLTALPASWLPFMLRLPNPLFRLLANKMLAIDPEAKLSMWWDLSQGKITEVDYLNGALVREGEAVGIACPANQAIVKLIHQTESRGLQGSSAYSAQALLDLINQK